MTGRGLISGEANASDRGPAPAYVRSGIALYGLAPTEALAPDLDLLPAMSMKARVTHLRTIDAGTSVSYGARWTAERPTRLATLGAGYGDGYPRLGSGTARVRIGGEMRPVVGTICMDMCMVDLGPPSGPLARRIEVGDAATLFGPGGPTAYDVARWAKTIPYEICCGLSRRVPRSYLPS
jgi:alanine racemase